MSRRKSHILKFCSAILNYDHTLQIELYITVVFIDLQALSKHQIKAPDKSRKIVKQDNLAIGQENLQRM